MAQIDYKWEQLLKKSQPRNFSGAIVFDILSRLPVKSILRFKSVCREWYSIFGDSQFIEAHLNRSIEESDCCYLGISDKETGDAFTLRREENFEELCELHLKPQHSCEYRIVASANGIVCISKLAFRFSRRYGKIMVYLYILLWNPATRESRMLPKFPGQEKCCNNVGFGARLGFGFEPKNNDYKVVAIFRPGDVLKVNVNVYSLSTDSWTAVAEVDSLTYLLPIMVHVNGSIHFLGSSPSRILIVSFDVSEEKIIEMGVPEFHPDNPKLKESPASLGKSLILCHRTNKQGYQIWFMKEYGDSKSWSKLYYFPPHPYGSLIDLCIFLDNGEILMQMQYDEMLLYDPKNQVYKILNIDYLGQVVKYKESLVSVRGGGSINNCNHCASISNNSMD